METHPPHTLLVLTTGGDCRAQGPSQGGDGTTPDSSSHSASGQLVPAESATDTTTLQPVPAAVELSTSGDSPHAEA